MLRYPHEAFFLELSVPVLSPHTHRVAEEGAWSWDGLAGKGPPPLKWQS